MIIFMKPYKGRKIDYSKKVRVYRNLHNGLLSIKQGAHVVAHTSEIDLQDVKFLVNEKKRLQVVRERKKNVHAYVEGYLLRDCSDTVTHTKQVLYNPYKASHFHGVDGLPIHGSNYALIKCSGHMIAWDCQ